MTSVHGGEQRGDAMSNDAPCVSSLVNLPPPVFDAKGEHAREQYSEDDEAADGSEWTAGESTQAWSQEWTVGNERRSSWWIKKTPAEQLGGRLVRSRSQAHESRMWEPRFQAHDNRTWEPRHRERENVTTSESRLRTRQWRAKDKSETSEDWSKTQLHAANDDTIDDCDAPLTETWVPAADDHDDSWHRKAAVEDSVHAPRLPPNTDDKDKDTMRTTNGKYARNTKSQHKGHRASLGSETPGSAKQAAQLFRTSLCAFFSTSGCNKGDQCPHAHSVEELRHRPTLTKTRLCETFHETGQCSNGDKCVYAHGASELRATDSFFKTRMCRAGAKCKVGDKCRYAHSPAELQTPSKVSTASSALSHTPGGFSEVGRAKTEYSSDALTSPTDNDTFRSSIHSQHEAQQENYPVSRKRPYDGPGEHRDDLEQKDVRSPYTPQNAQRHHALASSAPKYTPSPTSKPQKSTDSRPPFTRPPPRPTPPCAPASPHAKPVTVPADGINLTHAIPTLDNTLEPKPLSQHQIMQIMLRQQLHNQLDPAFASEERYRVASDTASSSPQHRAAFEFSPSAAGAAPTCLLHLESALAIPPSYSIDYHHDIDMMSHFFPQQQHLQPTVMGNLASAHHHAQQSVMMGQHMASVHAYPQHTMAAKRNGNPHRTDTLSVPMPDSQCDMPTPEHSPRDYYFNLSIPTPDPSPRLLNHFDATPDHSPRMMTQFPATPEGSPRHFQTTMQGSAHHFMPSPDSTPHHFTITPQRSTHPGRGPGNFDSTLTSSLHHHVSPTPNEDTSPYHFIPWPHFDSMPDDAPHHMRTDARGSPQHCESTSEGSPSHVGSRAKGSPQHLDSPQQFEF